MTSKQLVTAPDREVLRALYDTAVFEIQPNRDCDLKAGFYASTGSAVFNAGCLALSDTATDTHRMHTVSAPAGGGKTSFSYALAAAVTRYANGRPDAPYGTVFVVDQIEKADTVYRDLSALLPGLVAIWTSDHDRKCKQPEKIKNPAAQFAPEELRRYPIAVVTHAFYLGTRGHNARGVDRNGHLVQRALTIVDEKPDEAPSLDLMLSEAEKVREALAEAYPETQEHIEALLRFMERYSHAERNRLYRPSIEIDHDKLREELGWFTTNDAQRLAKSASNIPGTERLFSFANALVTGRAFVASGGASVHFTGYEERRIIDKAAGTILLDATADIDGVSSIVAWRAETDTPKASYDNLQIIHVPQHTKKRLTEYLKTAANQRAYVKWMVETIKQNMTPGERGLVICKQVLFKQERVPNWADNDARFKDVESYTKQYGWEIEGRKLCATWWGTGVGSNAWKDADVVFLFDEFFIPRRIAAASTQSYRGHMVHEGDLGSMGTLNSKAHGVDLIADGHALRWTKQLALRGRARCYDQHGVCGKQRLVVGSDLKRFMANASRLFPGAKISTAGDHSDSSTWATKILETLIKTTQDKLPSKVLGKLIGKPWRAVSSNVLTPDFMNAIAALRWRYVSLKGRGGARFEKLPLPPGAPSLC